MKPCATDASANFDGAGVEGLENRLARDDTRSAFFVRRWKRWGHRSTINIRLELHHDTVNILRVTSTVSPWSQNFDRETWGQMGTNGDKSKLRLPAIPRFPCFHLSTKGWVVAYPLETRQAREDSWKQPAARTEEKRPECQSWLAAVHHLTCVATIACNRYCFGPRT